MPAVFLGTNFAGLGYPSSGTEPPSPCVAVGPTAVVETVQNAIVSYNKATAAVLTGPQNLEVFFKSVIVGNETITSSAVEYDEYTGRFIVAADALLFPGGNSALYLALSKDSNPADGFNAMTRIDTTSYSIDFPFESQAYASDMSLAWNADKIIVTFDMFDPLSKTYAGNSIWMTDPNTLQSFEATTFFGGGTSPLAGPDLIPAVMHASAPGGPAWFIRVADSTQVQLIELPNSDLLNGSPQSFSLTLPSAIAPVNDPTQPNGSKLDIVRSDIAQSVDPLQGAGFVNAAVRGNTLVASEQVGSGSDTHARWYEFDLSGGSPTGISGDIPTPVGTSTYAPAIDIAPDQSLGMS